MRRVWDRGAKIGLIVAAVIAIPTAAFAAVGAFSSSTATSAVTGTNSSAAAGARAVWGNQTGGGTNNRYGVVGAANGPAGIGVYGTGTKFGVLSNGPFQSNGNATIASGKTLTCTRCVSPSDLSSGVGVRAKARIAYGSTVVTSTPGVTVTSISAGRFCVHFPVGVVTDNEVVVVSPDYLNSPDVNVETQWYGANILGCTGEVIFTLGGPLAGPLAFTNEGFDLIVT